MFYAHFWTYIVAAYLDDILIFSENLKDHKRHVREVLGALQKNGLHLAAEKCEFHRTSVKYLGFIISTKGCTPDPAKIETVVNWGKPDDESLESKDILKKKKFSNLTSVQRFLGFANFYWRFIKNYSGIVASLTKLSGKNILFVWTIECQAAVDTCKGGGPGGPKAQRSRHSGWCCGGRGRRGGRPAW